MPLIFGNPGHDRTYDSGAVNPVSGLREADVVYDVWKLVEKHLNAIGYETKSVQSDNLWGENPSLPCVTDEANKSGADLFVSIHCNAFNTRAKGTETLCYTLGGAGFELAKCIQNQIITSIGTLDRGVKARPDLAVLKRTDMPAVLIELAFIDNAEDVTLLDNEKSKDEFARAIARGITDYFNL